ncbi:MAG: DUF4013 domain-containing protein, partial [Halobacteriaceae archaeon]
ISYPKEGESAVKTIAIGGVLTLFGFLLIPILPVMGYLLRVLRETYDDHVDEPPVFEEWETLFVDGIKVLVVSFVYNLVPAIILFVFAGGAVVGLATGDTGAAGLGIASLFGGFVLAGIVGLVLFYILPAGLVNMGRTGRLGSAFAFSELRPVLFNGDYAMNWLMSIAVFIIAGVVSGLVGMIPLLGWIAGAFIGFYAYVASAYLWGRGVNSAGGFDGEGGEPTERGAVA